MAGRLDAPSGDLGTEQIGQGDACLDKAKPDDDGGPSSHRREGEVVLQVVGPQAGRNPTPKML